MERHCGHCGKELKNETPSRFYFEDDSWLCLECFGTERTEALPHGSRATELEPGPRSAVRL